MLPFSSRSSSRKVRMVPFFSVVYFSIRGPPPQKKKGVSWGTFSLSHRLRKAKNRHDHPARSKARATGAAAAARPRGVDWGPAARLFCGMCFSFFAAGKTTPGAYGCHDSKARGHGPPFVEKVLSKGSWPLLFEPRCDHRWPF